MNLEFMGPVQKVMKKGTHTYTHTQTLVMVFYLKDKEKKYIYLGMSNFFLKR